MDKKEIVDQIISLIDRIGQKIVHITSFHKKKEKLFKRYTMTKREERRKRRNRRISQSSEQNDASNQGNEKLKSSDSRPEKDIIVTMLAKNEDDLLNFVVKVNKIYQEKLNRPAPFMTFVICGMQSAGKSTIMERFLSAVLNIIQEGTGTRCPLDTTCIHDDNLIEPLCDLSGEELPAGMGGEGLSVSDVFQSITQHNKKLAEEDRFSTKELRLVYRSNKVQNMRFVDTPGIISNKGQGKDNRDDIKCILRSTMKRPNTKLCCLLEPKEYSTNPIIDFCDETFDGKRKWVENSIFIMNKFDKQFGDARSGSKANCFFNEFNENGIYPHLVMTPTLPKEDLPSDTLYEARKSLLNNATEEEESKFEHWLSGHDKFIEENPDDELLHNDIRKRIGFDSAKNEMRKIMLEDTALRLPEVLQSLREDLGLYQNKLTELKEKARFNDASEVKLVIGSMLQQVQRRMCAYLDGDLETAVKMPQVLQTLDEELEDEEDSDWCDRVLNHYTEKEEDWRERLSSLEYPTQIQAQKQFHGGKQVQRAIETFGLVMIGKQTESTIYIQAMSYKLIFSNICLLESLPDPFQLREVVGNGAGYLQGGLQRENWERAITAIVKMTVKEVSHPGINFLIKHVGQIFRRMFVIALEDVKHGEEFSATLKLIPSQVETFLTGKFDEMLWEVMEGASKLSHQALEPMYSTLDPTLPTFDSSIPNDNEEDENLYKLGENGSYVKTQSKKEKQEHKMMEGLKQMISKAWNLNGEEAKKMLSEHNLKKATEKKHFLPDQRTAMINDEEVEVVITTAFKYIIALMQFNNTILRFQIHHYLYQGFKKELDSFTRKVLLEDWTKLVNVDAQALQKEITEVKDKLDGLRESLHEVQRIQAKLS